MAALMSTWFHSVTTPFRPACDTHHDPCITQQYKPTFIGSSLGCPDTITVPRSTQVLGGAFRRSEQQNQASLDSTRLDKFEGRDLMAQAGLDLTYLRAATRWPRRG
jgi:hypothetical protein